jgi:hypothetical protein
MLNRQVEFEDRCRLMVNNGGIAENRWYLKLGNG